MLEALSVTKNKASPSIHGPRDKFSTGHRTRIYIQAYYSTIVTIVNAAWGGSFHKVKTTIEFIYRQNGACTMRAYSNVPIVGPVLVAYLYTMAYSAYSDTLDSRNSTHDRVYPSVVSMHGPLFSVHFKAELRLLYCVPFCCIAH